MTPGGPCQPGCARIPGSPTFPVGRVAGEKGVLISLPGSSYSAFHFLPTQNPSKPGMFGIGSPWICVLPLG